MRAALRCSAVVFAALALLMLAHPAQSAKPDNIDDSEMALLPPYCPDTWGFKYGDAYYNTSPNAPKWVGMMGKGFWAMHHYCWALLNLNRVSKPTMSPQWKKALRESAIDDMNYVIKNVGPDFIILPEIYTKIGEVQLDLGNELEASRAFERAREHKPDYWPAYFQWGEYLRRKGDKGQARQIVAEGLAWSPRSTALQKLYRDLGGDPRSVKPHQAASAATASPQAAKAEPSSAMKSDEAAAPETAPAPPPIQPASARAADAASARKP